MLAEQKIYQCKKCGKILNNRYAVGAHCSMVHPLKPRKKFLQSTIEKMRQSFKNRQEVRKTCEECKKEFLCNSSSRKVCKTCAPNGFFRHMLRNYGITKNQYDSMLFVNNGLCWICLKRRAQVVDHCHKTEKVRGLLCKFCNTSLYLIEDKECFERAKRYLLSDAFTIKQEVK